MVQLTLYPDVVSPAFLLASTHFIRRKKALSISSSVTVRSPSVFTLTCRLTRGTAYRKKDTFSPNPSPNTSFTFQLMRCNLFSSWPGPGTVSPPDPRTDKNRQDNWIETYRELITTDYSQFPTSLDSLQVRSAKTVSRADHKLTKLYLMARK